MTPALDTHPSVAVYTPTRLALYDPFILGLSCALVWKCPKRRERHVRTAPPRESAGRMSLQPVRFTDVRCNGSTTDCGSPALAERL